MKRAIGTINPINPINPIIVIELQSYKYTFRSIIIMQFFILTRKVKTTRFGLDTCVPQLYSEILMDISTSREDLIYSWNSYVDHTLSTLSEFLNFPPSFRHMTKDRTELMYTYESKDGEAVTRCDVAIKEFEPWSDEL